MANSTIAGPDVAIINPAAAVARELRRRLTGLLAPEKQTGKTRYLTSGAPEQLVAMLATALNLLPFGQLDGGHLTYATLRRWATPLSLVTVGAGLVMTFFTRSWMVFTFMMMVMLIVFGPRHPTVIHEDEPLPTSRYWIGAFALLMLILCISPVPMELIFPNTPAPAAPPR